MRRPLEDTAPIRAGEAGEENLDLDTGRVKMEPAVRRKWKHGEQSGRLGDVKSIWQLSQRKAK